MNVSRTAVVLAAVFALLAAGQGFAADSYTISTDHIYGHKAGMALTFDTVRPADSNGVGLLLMVSAGWRSDYFDLEKAMKDSENQGGRFTTLIDRGFTLFVVRHGSGPYFKVPDAVADVRRAVRYIRYRADEFGVNPDRLGVFGASAGGHLSLMLGTASDAGTTDAEDPVDRVGVKVAAVVAYFPPVDLRGNVGPSDRFRGLDFSEAEAAKVSPILHVSSDDAPTLLIHGDADDRVPISHSELMLAALKEAKVPTNMIVMEGAGHGFYGNHGREAAAALTDWFERHLVLQHTD